MSGAISTVEKTPFGDFNLWPLRIFNFGHGDESLVEISLGNGDDCSARVSPANLAQLADDLEFFANAIRQYHWHLTTEHYPFL